MIDHVTLPVHDLEASKRFYEQALAPLGGRVAFGKDQVFWAFALSDGLFEIQQAAQAGPLTQVHVAFRAQNRDAVAAFYRAALAAGARDNGPRGPRPGYSPGYFAAFVIDPNGYNIEAMIDEAVAAG